MMTRICALLVHNLHPANLPAWLKRLALAAFCSFGVAAPFASATCSNKALGRYVSVKPVTAATQNSAGAVSSVRNPPSIVGLWNVTFSSGGQVVDVAYDAWHSDGTEIL